MASEIDATIRLAMDQSFATVHQGMQQSALRFNDVGGFITQQAQYNFMNESQLVGATAAGNLQKGHLSGDVLAQRSAAGQPGNAPSGAVS